MNSLKKLPIWLVWKKTEVKSSDALKSKRYTKIPHQITGKHASSTNPDHWTTFENAQKASEIPGKFSGIGFSISKNYPLLCIDLDHCIDTDGNLTREDFAFFLDAANTYAETSPGGDGLHIILELENHFSLAGNKKVHDDGTAFEVYTEGRYFTYTGKSYGTEKEVRKVSLDEADELLRMVGYPWGKKEEVKPKIDATTINLDLADHVVLKKMFNSKGGAAIEALYKGDISKYNEDGSAGDSALCTHLAFWTQKNLVQMERLWKSSPLGQRKKTQERDDYVKRTVKNCAEKCERVYSPAPLIKDDSAVQPDLNTGIRYSTNEKGIPFVNAFNVRQILESDTSLNKSFRFNKFSHEHETNVRNGVDFMPLQKDELISTMIYIQSTYSFFEKVTVQTIQEAAVSLAHDNVVNPPVDMIKEVTWDKTDRISHWLFHTFGVEQNKVHEAIASNWLKGLVNRVISPGCKFDTVLVLEGAQGIGKSTALRALADPWYAETTMDIDTKDFQLILTQNIVVEFSEGASLSRSANAAMKQKITDQEDNFRKPYDRTSQKYPRHCVFAMTTNEDQYLKDATGNRRWLPVALPNQPANIAWLKENRLQLFAEAYHRVYELKETTYEFPKGELEKLQSERMEEDPFIGKITEWYFNFLNDTQRDEGITAIQAYEEGVHGGEFKGTFRPGENQRIASILTNHLKLIKRRNVINNVRAHRYLATNDTDIINKLVAGDLTQDEQDRKDWRQYGTVPVKSPITRSNEF